MAHYHATNTHQTGPLITAHSQLCTQFVDSFVYQITAQECTQGECQKHRSVS